MKIFALITDLVKNYPKKFFLTLGLLFALAFIEMGSVLTIAPLVDLITRPNLSGASAITLKIIEALKYCSLPPNLYSVMTIIVLFNILKASVSILVYSSILKIKYALNKDLLCDTYESFFNSSWRFFTSNNQGVLGNTFIKEINKVGDSFGAIARMFAVLFQMVFYFFLAFIVSWKLSLMVLFLSFFACVPFLLLGRISYGLGKINLVTANNISELIYENLSAAKIILGFGAQKKGVVSLEKTVQKHVDATQKYQIFEYSTPTAFQPLSIIILVCSLFVSRVYFKLPLGELTVVLFSFYSALPLISQIITFKNSLSNFFPSYEQVNHLRKLAQEAKQPSGSIAFQGISRSIALENITFSYPGQEAVIKNMNIIIPKGKMIALIGKSGVGKSTIIDLLLRFYDPNAGSILVDGVDLNELEILSWRRKIGYVPQDSFLFNGTINENLIWGKENASQEEIRRVCKMANVEEFIDSLPNGLDTLVGDRGVLLSGGQRQRIALARAIIRKPELLILDEATSSLDSHSEKMIQNSIENLSQETTVVIVAHRLSTIVKADNIYLIDDGQVVEKGTFADLCARKGKSYELAKMQGMA